MPEGQRTFLPNIAQHGLRKQRDMHAQMPSAPSARHQCLIKKLGLVSAITSLRPPASADFVDSELCLPRRHLGWNIGSMFLGTNLGLKQDLWSNMGSIFVGTDLRVKGDLVELKSKITRLVPWK